jgi:hypothetical protein
MTPVVLLPVQERLALCGTGATPFPLNDITGEVPTLLENDSAHSSSRTLAAGTSR